MVITESISSTNKFTQQKLSSKTWLGKNENYNRRRGPLKIAILHRNSRHRGITRMHFSRMCTARLLTVSQHALRGGVPMGGGHLPKGGVPAQGGVPGRGVPAQGWCVPAQVLPPVNRMTDRCKNITLTQTSFVGGKQKHADSILSSASIATEVTVLPLV